MSRAEQLTLFDGNPEYAAFVEKFKPKKTTDDCYTPDGIFEAVAAWVVKEYGVDRAAFVRPFWPGEDYETEQYPDGCVVVDNPPFSIISKIIRFFAEEKIRFFVFSPALTLLTRRDDVTHIATGATITYENGATVKTSFVTNLDDPDIILRTAPDLKNAVDAASREIERMKKKSFPKYIYPDHIVTAAMAQRWCEHGVEYRLSRRECVRVAELDAQKAFGKSIFCGGYLLSERAAAERAAAERWTLSEREKIIVAGLSGRP